jgi:hypothetical protein
MSGRIAKIKDIVNGALSNGAKLLSFKVDFQGTAHQAIATGIAGIDAKPILKDNAVTIKQENSGSQPFVIGTNDVISQSVTSEGEIQIYSRDAEGVKQADILIKADGSIKLSNSSGSFELKADGSCEATGDIVTSGDVVIGGISFLQHIHSYIDSQGQAATPVQSETEAPQ